MAAIRTTANMIVREILRPSPALSSLSMLRTPVPRSGGSLRVLYRGIIYSPVRCAASDSGAGKKAPSRLAQMQQLMSEAEERALSAGNEPIPKITLGNLNLLKSKNDVCFLNLKLRDKFCAECLTFINF